MANHVTTTALRRGGLALLALGVAAPAAGASFAAPDGAFGTNGGVTTAVGSSNDVVTAVAVQPDGKIVTAGWTDSGTTTDIAVVRYARDGTRDGTFGQDGIAVTDIAGFDDGGYAVVVQPDGAIVAGGETYNGANYDFALVRYLADGHLDPGFGTGGTATTDFGATGDHITALALQPDGKLVAAGYSAHNGSFDYVLARYNTDGSPDTGFGAGGKVVTALGANKDYAVALALQPDGKIVIASGYGTAARPVPDFFVARYNPDGSLDIAGFNPGKGQAPEAGTAVADMQGGSNDFALAVALQPDGKIVTAGSSTANSLFSTQTVALARFNADGTLDTTFGANGTVTVGSNAHAAAVVVQPNGKIITAGQSSNGFVSDFSLNRFGADGTADGAAVMPFGSHNSFVNALALQPGGALVTAGAASNGNNDDFAVARLIPDDAPWDLTPDAFAFTDAGVVAPNGTETSDMITIAGLAPDTSVPVRVSGGEYAKNGATAYTTDLGWARNGDTFNVRHTASAGAGRTVKTVLTVGGLLPVHDPAVTLGTPASGTFSSTTQGGGGGGGGNSGGKGAAGPVALLLLAGAARAVRRRPQHRRR